MEFKIFNDIVVTLSDGHNQEYFEKLIEKAILFLKKEFNISENSFNLNILFSNNYEIDVNLVHFKSNGKDNANANMIPIIFQNESYRLKNKAIIIINWDKIRFGTTDDFIISVIIHELVHYIDYLKAKEFSDRYGVDFGNNKRDTKEDYLGGYYCNRSEMRAKYYQEKYYYRSTYKENNLEVLSVHISKNYEKVENTGDWYNMSRACGQLKYWEEISMDDGKIIDIIEERKKELIKNNELIKLLPKIFKLSDFYDFADKLDSDSILL